MTDMVCANCGRTGIAWVGPLDNPTGTRCPHCGGENCQRVAPSEGQRCDECGGLFEHLTRDGLCGVCDMEMVEGMENDRDGWS